MTSITVRMKKTGLAEAMDCGIVEGKRLRKARAFFAWQAER